ncbi:hypothetical protein [Crocosphaera sp.]|uniref:hypothetical protein n=1 Tax=Crocosphaera sp. TaxID=2729996 RepID=UPI002627982E|nr:hypothetical protein [Crocosphaera sp.]MDJ0581205.1 hypothetical protein [Crocosphaera sp.]
MKSSIIISAPHIVVPQSYWKPLLGEILRDADLITEAQLQTVLRDQQEYKDQKIGEILALRGWLKQETVDFFAEEWTSCLQQGPKYPIGEYLKQASLLKQKDIEYILELQQKIPVKFGEIAVHQELIKETTLNFFLDNLFGQASINTLFLS